MLITNIFIFINSLYEKGFPILVWIISFVDMQDFKCWSFVLVGVGSCMGWCSFMIT